MTTRRLTLTTLVSLCVLAMGLLPPGTPAQAALTHDHLSQITEVPASSSAPLTGRLSEIEGMTVDSDDLYVVDHRSGTREHRLDKFNASSGKFISQIVHNSEDEEFVVGGGVAVGHSTGEAVVYAGATEHYLTSKVPVVAAFGESGSLLRTWEGTDTPNGAFGEVSDIAVDNSTSLADWAAGDVYVVDRRNALVDVFEPQAEGKEKYVTQLTGTEPEPGVHVPFSHPSRVSVDESNGDVSIKPNSPRAYL